MFEWFTSFLSELDKEAAAILGTFAATIIVGVVAGFRGFKKGTPAPSTTAHAISQISCGAPELKTELISMKNKHHELVFMISSIQRDVERVSEQITRVEDRTRAFKPE